jgi:hypothetical protein
MHDMTCQCPPLDKNAQEKWQCPPLDKTDVQGFTQRIFSQFPGHQNNISPKAQEPGCEESDARSPLPLVPGAICFQILDWLQVRAFKIFS